MSQAICIVSGMKIPFNRHEHILISTNNKTAMVVDRAVLKRKMQSAGYGNTDLLKQIDKINNCEKLLEFLSICGSPIKLPACKNNKPDPFEKMRISQVLISRLPSIIQSSQIVSM